MGLQRRFRLFDGGPGEVRVCAYTLPKVRWTVPIQPEVVESGVLICLRPTGRLDYGISALGYAGYGITAAGWCFSIGTVFFRVNDKLKAFAAQTGAWLQLPSPKQSKEDVIRLKLQKKVRS